MAEPFIRICNLHQTFGKQHVLRGVTLDIFRGETLVLLGASGGGKSVLVKHLAGLLQPQEGEIWINNVNITGMNERELGPIRRQIGMMFQGGALFDSMTVFNNVAFPLREDSELKKDEITERVINALSIVKLAEHGDKYPSDISGGMRKRVALARAVVDTPACIIYDEPHAGLDPVTAASIDIMIKDLQVSQGITNIVITHEIRSVFRIADRVVFMKEGEIYWQGTPKELQVSKNPILHNFIEGIADETTPVLMEM
jgi:phospholipid/cholesterol/gamma-HCH transport system ATP-binding protein